MKELEYHLDRQHRGNVNNIAWEFPWAITCLAKPWDIKKSILMIEIHKHQSVFFGKKSYAASTTNDASIINKDIGLSKGRIASLKHVNALHLALMSCSHVVKFPTCFLNQIDRILAGSLLLTQRCLRRIASASAMPCLRPVIASVNNGYLPVQIEHKYFLFINIDSCMHYG